MKKIQVTIPSTCTRRTHHLEQSIRFHLEYLKPFMYHRIVAKECEQVSDGVC
jgi:hypothetical protein